ncbi:MAG TPA: fumarylacetoacetate hydrolase family protein [Tepidisphaeraceae bacterium]|jgi:2-dehydro-3-deoxy-D-arabinonate dehydratase|nr:fumarylacetoacetate hydrolase family protein [Tepidisphaeraceae bacterium]
MKLYLSTRGPTVEQHGTHYALPQSWDEVINADDIIATATEAIAFGASHASPTEFLAPIGSQEVWAAGVTYFRSRTARMEEAKSAGGGDFYDRVYAAARPELFFKGMGHRAVGNDRVVRFRRDSKWNVPEPELTLVVNRRGKIVGYTIGNDMSSRDIEGENPLYLPQAKVYDGSCALGPAVLVAENPLPKSTEISIRIDRAGATVFQGATTLAQMKREPEELVEYLYRETSFGAGCYLLTGTGVVPPDAFTLQSGDEVRITIEPIGTLRNVVA